MIFVLKANAQKEKVDEFIKSWEKKGYSAFLSKGTERTAVCLIGNTSKIDMDNVVHTTSIVEYGKRITEQYKTASRTFHPNDTEIEVGEVIFDSKHFPVISGPCSVESEEQIIMVARAVKKSGAKILRGGAFKPRSSPYSFQGLGEEGIRYLISAKKDTGLPIITEIMNQTQLHLFEDVDIIQVGARNMQNFDLLKVVGGAGKPVLLKRGLASTLEDLLLSAEYLMSSGCCEIILCERGIRTFETATRNTLDISGIPLLKQKTHFPVIVDPSHATGIRSLIKPLSRAILSVGADGLMVETHNNPASALCDGAQSLDLKEFDDLMIDLKNRATIEQREI